MKKRVLHITSGLIIIAAMALPSCEFLEQCGNCELVSRDFDGNVISISAPEFVCGDIYLERKDSEITPTVDGDQYWVCE